MTHDEHHDDDPSRRFNLGVWRRILAQARPFRWHAVGLSLVAVAVAVCEILLPYLTGRIIDRVTTYGVDRQLWSLGAAYVTVAALLCAAILGFILLAGRIATGVSHEIRKASFAKLQMLPFAYFDRRPVGWLMSRLTSDCDRLSRIIGWTLLDFLWGLTMVVGIAGVMLLLNWRLGLIVLTVVPPLAVISVVFQRRLLQSARAIRKANAEITAKFNESIMGVRTTKALVREQANLGEFKTASQSMYADTVRNSLQSAVYVPMVISLGSVMAGLALWFGGAQVLGGAISIGVLVTFMNYAGLFFDPIHQMARHFTEVQMAQAAAERIQSLLDTEPAIQDSPQVRSALATHADRSLPPDVAPDGGVATIRSVEFRHVSFAYDGGQHVLKDFDLTVGAGETVALVGPTGGGKSTIVSLLCRFYEPTSGQVLVGDVDYRERSLAWLQSSLAVVLQTPHLFSGTIGDNIRYGDLNAEDDQIVHAAKLAGAHDFIERLPDGYAADVGEGGSRLSTGEKQLVSLARAILADPQIFVMDEATSSVDTETEYLIQQGIEHVLRGRISFVIAHRLSTVRSADRILVIQDGGIAESGNHEQLLQLRGRYFELYMNQFATQKSGALARDSLPSETASGGPR